MIHYVRTFYRRMFRGTLFIIKAGGRVITDDKCRANLLENIKELNKDGIDVFLIYGGGHAIDDGMKEAGITPFKIDGRRITSETDIAIVKKVMAGDLGYRLVETMGEIGLDGVVMNAIPPAWATYKRRPKKEGITRFDGEITGVNKASIKDFFEGPRFAACPCLGIYDAGVTLNINADNVAIAMASGLKATKLILLTDVDGVLVNGEKASVLTGRETEQLIADGIVTGGMQVKLENCVAALRSGVKRVHIINGFTKDALKKEVYTKEGIGTMIIRHNNKKLYEMEVGKKAA
jgi:acetylglutamate kinase